MREGLLLINLGSPERPTRASVRRYLRQFLMDRHVLDIHWSLRSLLVHGWIAPTRASRSAHAYQAIWTTEGSPLLRFSESFADKIQEALPKVEVELAMRYGRPTIASALRRLREAGVEKLRIVPLYPQFAKSSSLTAIETVLTDRRRLNWNVEIQFLPDFFDQSEWIDSLAANIRQADEAFRSDFLVMSYHGLPEHHIREAGGPGCLTTADCCARVTAANRHCYRAQCFATSRALATAAGRSSDRYTVSFQSRLGRRPWIKPYSDVVIVELAKRGVRRILVTCPSFVADCLETLEEVAIRMKRDFLAAGGEDLKLVPALNGSPLWSQRFTSMLARNDLQWWNEKDVAAILGKVR